MNLAGGSPKGPHPFSAPATGAYHVAPIHPARIVAAAQVAALLFGFALTTARLKQSAQPYATVPLAFALGDAWISSAREWVRCRRLLPDSTAVRPLLGSSKYQHQEYQLQGDSRIEHPRSGEVWGRSSARRSQTCSYASYA
jgi:hypothetical protein